MCVASDSRTNVVAMLLFVENEYEICILSEVWVCPELPTITLHNYYGIYIYMFEVHCVDSILLYYF